MNFQSHKRRGLCCFCKQQWVPRVTLSHLRAHRKQQGELDTYWVGKVAEISEVIMSCLTVRPVCFVEYVLLKCFLLLHCWVCIIIILQINLIKNVMTYKCITHSTLQLCLSPTSEFNYWYSSAYLIIKKGQNHQCVSLSILWIYPEWLQKSSTETFS